MCGDLVFISGIRFFVVWMLSVFVVWCVLWSSHVEKGVVLSGWCVSRSHCLLCRFYRVEGLGYMASWMDVFGYIWWMASWMDVFGK